MNRLLTILTLCLLLTACSPKQPASTVPPTQPPSIGIATESPTDAPTEESTAASAQTFTLYYGDVNAEHFLSKTVEVTQITETAVLEQLILAGILPEGTAINLFAAAGSQLNIDFNDAFLAHLNTMGTSGERILVGSVVNTFLSAYDAQSVMITVDGEIVESGHVIYDFPIEFMN